MKDEYIIINKTAIIKRIEDLRQVCNKELGYASDKIYFELEHLLSQSNPLISEIEKVLELRKRLYSTTDENIVKKYISNLKLDI